MKKLIIVLAGLFLLSGCNDKAETVQTMDWYKTHDAERKEMIDQCKNNPGELMLTPNCVNAKKARNQKESAKRGLLNGQPMKFSLRPKKENNLKINAE